MRLSRGKLCYKTKLIRTGFYNHSLQKGTVAPGILFLETSPPRDCLALGLCNMMAPNDNNFAVSYRVRDGDGGYRYAMMTDTEVHLDFDVETLDVIGKRDFQDDWGKALHMRKGGGTHLQCEAGKGTSAGDCWGDLYGLVFEQGASTFVDLYRLRSGRPDVRELVSRVKVPFAPGSFHSFGLTEDYAILPLSPFTLDALTMLEGKDLMHALKNKGETTPIYIVSLASGEVQELTFPGKMYYVHIVNSWQNSTHIIMDAAANRENSFSLDNPAIVLAALRNKTVRDTCTNLQGIRRYTVELSSGAVTESFIADGPSAIDFPRVNPANYGLPYCIYYGVEWKHNGHDYGSWALRKHNVCTGEINFFYEPSTYVSEGFFVPNGPGEDEGFLLTVQTNGRTNKSAFVTLDARTMQRVSEVPLPHRVGWFGHGAWYPSDDVVLA
jgi:carotenoid cleavage dioxygenase-like enzyme